MECIINVALGGWYPKGQARLVDSLRGRYDGAVRATQVLPRGSPPHDVAPYAFKVHAFMEAFEAGHNPVLWLDASMWARLPLAPVFEHIREHGVAVWLAGWWVGQWCHTAGLEQMGLTRDEAMAIPLVAGGIVGIDRSHPKGIEFFDGLYRAVRDGVSFPGPWSNVGGAMDPDPRVLGHRHDMPTLSVLAHRLQIPYAPQSLWAYAAQQATDDVAAIVCRGM